jgi:hypothetical protein
MNFHQTKKVVFWDIVPCSPLKIKQHFGESGGSIFRALLATSLSLVSCLAYSLTLKMETTFSSETSVGFHWITQHYIPEHGILHNHCCENFKSK